MISVLLAVSYLRRRSDPVRLQVKFPAAQIHIPSLQIHAIPTVGPSWPLLSYLGAWRYFRDAKGMILEGCSKVSQLADWQPGNRTDWQQYKVFKIPLSDQWLVIVSGQDMNDELRKYPDDTMSALEAQKWVRSQAVWAIRGTQ